MVDQIGGGLRHTARAARWAKPSAWRCADGGWLALSCWSADEFVRLGRTIGREDWATDAALASPPARQADAQRIAAAIAAWAAAREAAPAARLLQSRGVHAHEVASVADLFTDPQLAARRLWRRRPHAVIGEQAYCFPAFDLSEAPGRITGAAPLLGEHNRQVFVELLGLDEAGFEALLAKGAFA